jgi:hypothetical protein
VRELDELIVDDIDAVREEAALPFDRHDLAGRAASWPDQDVVGDGDARQQAAQLQHRLVVAVGRRGAVLDDIECD